MPELGKLLVVLGAITIVIGALVWAGLGNWIGRLPGDIRIQRGNGAFYFPIVTCVVISVLVSLFLALFRR